MSRSNSGDIYGCPAIGGQAVLEGVMLRNGDVYGLAVRASNGVIHAQRLPWSQITGNPVLRLPFVRGFTILLETLINGIRALNRSAALSTPENGGEPRWRMILSFCAALLVALGLFVIAPHLLSLLMMVAGLGGDVDSLSFYLWEGLYKCAIFVFYIRMIAIVPEIRRLFEYHGAEHKIVHAWENSRIVDASHALCMSRTHPRCGTTFILFVICLSIILQAVLLPALLHVWTPAGMAAKHALSVFYKLMLVVPISGAAYEMIRFADRLPPGLWADLLQWPGLALQKLTTREPDVAQLEVALAALAEALEPDLRRKVLTAGYMRIPDSLGECF